MNTNDLMGDLNEEQAAAVMLPLDTNVLIVAGAGTGKTTTLSRRVVHLLRSGVLASRVICCTFTNKATNEMRERIAKYAGEDQASRVRVSTLHALAGRIVGTHYRLLNIERRPLPLDEAASVKLMVHAWQSRSSSVSHDLVSDIALLGDAIEASSGMGSVRRQLRALHLITEDPSAPGKSRQLNSLEDLLAAAEAALKDVRSRERAYAVAALSVIERLQLQGLWPVQRILDMGAEGTRAVIASMISEKERDLFVENEGGDAASIGRFLEIYDLYMEAKKARSVMDFGDMVIMATRLMRDHPDVLSSYQDRYDYLMVDECQDLNSEQYAFIRVLSGDGKRMRVLMVGDQDQSIYAFRGANCMLMDEPFIRTFGARVVKLTRNYRSVPQIVKLSNKAISMNVKRIPKDLVPHSTKSGVVCAKEFATDRIADPWMVNQIGRSISMANISPSEIAILSRRNDDLLSTARALTVAGIPNRIIGAAHMFESPAVREALNWAILCLRNDRDDLVGGCLSAPSVGLGEVSIAALEGDALAAGMSCLEFLQNPPRSLRKAEMAALERYHGLMQSFRSGRIDVLMDAIVNARFGERGTSMLSWNESLKSRGARAANFLKDLVLIAREVQSRIDADGPEMDDAGEALHPVEEMLLFVRLQAGDIGIESGGIVIEEEAPVDAVQLMTIHKAKGLEFDTVFYMNADDTERLDDACLGYYGDMAEPGGLSDVIVGDIEEARRLAYVAMTRAKRRLIFTRSAQRMINGKTVMTNWSDVIRSIIDDDVKVL